MDPDLYLAFGDAFERAVLEILSSGLFLGQGSKRHVALSSEELARGGSSLELWADGRRGEAPDQPFSFHLLEGEFGAERESFFLPDRRKVTPGIVQAVFHVPVSVRKAVVRRPSRAAKLLLAPHDLSGSVDFWTVAALHVR